MGDVGIVAEKYLSHFRLAVLHRGL
jgi:hypothetical protein